MIYWRPIISEYRSDFNDFLPSGKYLTVSMIDLTFSRPLKDVAIATNFGANSLPDLHLSLWYFETDWNIATPMENLIAYLSPYIV